MTASLEQILDSDRSELDSMNEDLICTVSGLRHRYDESDALDGIDLQVARGEVVSILGPNGCGKTTLFRLLCTLMPIQSGQITIDGIDATGNPLGVRGKIGIVFQSPSLDKKLTVDENIACQAALYGIGGADLKRRRDEVLEQLQLTDRRSEFCEKLSGGLKRRVELAKGMLHQPALLLLDEPSTGLDPAARLQLWDSLQMMAASGTSILMTTHLLDEAEKADRVVIMDRGRIIADGAPAELRSGLGQGVVAVTTADPGKIAEALDVFIQPKPVISGNEVRFAAENAAFLVPTIATALEKQDLSGSVQSISVGPPSLEDVFVERTGQLFHTTDQ